MSITKRSGWAVAVRAISVIGVLAATPAYAADVYWANPVNSNYTWAGGPWTDNVTATGLPLPWPAAPPPVSGDRIMLVNSVNISGTTYPISAADCAIDVAGATVNLPASSMGFGYGGRNWSFYDSATLTPNNNPLTNPTDFNYGGYGSLEAAAAASTQTLTLGSMDWSKSGNPYFFMPVVVTGTMLNPENGPLHFYGPATIGTDGIPRNNGWTADLYYHGDATIGTKITSPNRGIGDGEETWFYAVTNIATFDHQGGSIYFEPTSSGTVTTLNQSGAGKSQLVMKSTAVTITNYNWTAGTYVAGADGTLAALGATPTLEANQVLSISVPQTVSVPTMLTVKADSALAGNMTHAVYSGAGQNITFENNAVFAEGVAPASGPLTKADLDPGVVIWKGVLSAQGSSVNEAGDDGTSPYKGLSLNNAWTTDYNNNGLLGRFKALPGSGDLFIKVDDGFGLHYNNGPYFHGDSTAVGAPDNTSSTVNFIMDDNGSLNARRAFNHTGASSATQISDPDQIYTFNFTRDPGYERNNIFTTSEQGKLFANQDLNISNGRMELAGFMNMGVQGDVTLTNGVWNINTAFTSLDTGTLTLAGRTTLELALGGQVKDYALEALGGFSYSGLPMAIFSDNNAMNIYDWDYASNPVFADFMKHVDYGCNHYHNVDIGGVGLYIGDGKFLADAGTTNATSSYVAHDTTGAMPKILPGQPGAITMGFAAIVKNLSIGLEVDAPDATIQVGTTDPNRLLTSGGSGFAAAGIPTMRVTFQQNVTAKGVKVESGTGQFNQDLNVDTLSIRSGATFTMAAGRTATVNQLLTGGGTFTGGNGVLLTGTLAPGDSPGTLTGNVLSVGDGATYHWEILDPDGTAGDPGGWDLFMGGVVDLDPDNDNNATINFEIVDLGIPREILDPTERFLVASGTDLQLPTNNLTVNFSVVPDVFVWNLDDAALVPAPGGPGFELFLTGVTATLQTQAIPEPSTFVLAVLGLLLLAASRLRRRERR